MFLHLPWDEEIKIKTKNNIYDQLGGPSWTVQLGRRDSTTASLDSANTNLPGPTSDLTNLITAFDKKGFTTQEMVALSGNYTHKHKISSIIIYTR